MSMPQEGGTGQSPESGPGPQYGQPQPGPPPSGGSAYGGGQQPGGWPYGWPGGWRESPVDAGETRVTGRRVVQFIIDVILSGIVFGLLHWALQGHTGAAAAGLYLLLVLCDIAWYFLYWAYIPYARAGQTIGMSVMRIRVISKDGGPASLMQLFVRSILLMLFLPVSLLVGIITMGFSRYRQRVGDYMAGTVVVRAHVAPAPAPRQYAGAGQAGTR